MICGFCKVDKPMDQFGPRPNSRYALGWWCRPCENNRASVRKHGLTVEQKVTIAQAAGGCAICGHDDPGSKGWVVDHDHECCDGPNSCPKCRRGVLCGWCNKVLAYAFDRPRILTAAIKYLERHATGTCDWHMPVACSPRLCTNRTEFTDGEVSSTSGNESLESNAREADRHA